MRNKPDKDIKPYFPVPYRLPNKFIKQYDLDFYDPDGRHAIITYADFTDKKGRLVEKYTLYVKWSNNCISKGA